MPEEATGTGKVRSLGTGGECERQAFSGITRSHPYGLEKSRLVQTSVFRAARQDVHRIYYCGFIFRIIAGVDIGLLSRLYNREKLQSNLSRALAEVAAHYRASDLVLWHISEEPTHTGNVFKAAGSVLV